MIQMIYVQGGTFLMGSEPNYDGRPGHQVTLDSFHMGKYEVTQKEWKAVMGSNPSTFEGDKLPVENVSWEDVQEFIEKLNEKTGKKYRLPTEAEWEYAARGGKKSKGYQYAGSAYIDDVAWYDRVSHKETSSVGSLKPNELGIYDMSGNVDEWCSDWYDSYPTEAQTNPKGAEEGSHRVVRGGCWLNDPQGCRVAVRGSCPPSIALSIVGFRLAID